MSALATVYGKCTAKIDFSIGYLYWAHRYRSIMVGPYHIADADIGSLKSLRTLFDKYLDHMLVKYEQNRLIQSIHNFELFDKKWFTIFDKA